MADFLRPDQFNRQMAKPREETSVESPKEIKRGRVFDFLSKKELDESEIKTLTEKNGNDSADFDRIKTEIEAEKKTLNSIEIKAESGQELSREDLIFLYNISDPFIQGHGGQEQEKISEILKNRNVEKDILIIFDCEPSEIAYSDEAVNEKTKVYIGKWNPEIFQKIRQYSNIEHIFEAFPDDEIFKQTLMTDQSISSPETAKKILLEKDVYTSPWSEALLSKAKFSGEKKEYQLVSFTAQQLNLSKMPTGTTWEKVLNYLKGTELKLCPAEVGPQLCLQHLRGEAMLIVAMNPLEGQGGEPSLFTLSGSNGALLSARGIDGLDKSDKLIFMY